MLFSAQLRNPRYWQTNGSGHASTIISWCTNKKTKLLSVKEKELISFSGRRVFYLVFTGCMTLLKALFLPADVLTADLENMTETARHWVCSLLVYQLVKRVSPWQQEKPTFQPLSFSSLRIKTWPPGMLGNPLKSIKPTDQLSLSLPLSLPLTGGRSLFYTSAIGCRVLTDKHTHSSDMMPPGLGHTSSSSSSSSSSTSSSSPFSKSGIHYNNKPHYFQGH